MIRSFVEFLDIHTYEIAAHILNLIINDELTEMNDSIVRICNPVKYIKVSPATFHRSKECVKRIKPESKCIVRL